MDLFSFLFTQITTHLGVTPEVMFGTISLVVLGLNVLGRAIPDDKTGALGVVRKVAKVGGMYLSNRVSDGISVNDVVKTAPERQQATLAAAADIASTVAEGAIAKQVPSILQPLAKDAVSAAVEAAQGALASRRKK